jgi:L-2-hydroxyglutarate oxidase
MIHDFCVIGGGIVGLATALRLLEQRPGASLVLIEKEPAVATHQTGHNSGVIHAGVYYAPGSLKARLCTAGARATRDFAAQHGIPFDQCGKLIVATSPPEETRMAALHDRARQNGLEIHRLTAAELHSAEPGIAGTGALLVPSTAIIDYRLVSRKMAGEIARLGGEIRLTEQVTAITETIDAVEIRTRRDAVRARRLVVCGGLQSDRLARMAGLKIEHSIIPFRGEYYTLDARLDGAVKHLIYPVPNPEVPFLGIHLTKMIDGSTTVGPNATLGFAREGYPRLSINLRDVAAMVAFPGFWRTMRANLRHAGGEIRNSLFRSAYLRECRKYYPALQLSDLKPRPAGIRAQAVMRDGRMVEDFLFLSTDRMLHVCNAPSPAATSALPIASMIVTRLLGPAG